MKYLKKVTTNFDSFVPTDTPAVIWNGVEKGTNGCKVKGFPKNSAPAVEFVDLGLSVKWAKYNLGATGGSSAEDWYGGYYAWGEVASDKTDYIYTWDNYQYGSESPFSKYDQDGKTTLEASNDAVTVAYSSNFRMPTKAELEELTGLTNEWVSDYQGISGLNGRLFHGTGDYSANTLFIPYAGYCYVNGRNNPGTYGYIWSASLSDDVHKAWVFYSDGGGAYVYNHSGSRCYGLPIRPVMD